MKSILRLIASFGILILTLLVPSVGRSNPNDIPHSVLTRQTGTVLSIAFNPKKRNMLACGLSDGRIQVWDTSKHTLQYILYEYKDLIFSLAFSPDGKTLASGNADGTLRLWDVDTGKRRILLTEHTDIVTSLTFSADGGTLASGSADGTIRLWNPDTGEKKKVLQGYEVPVASLAFSPTENILVTGRADNIIRVWDLGTGTLRHILLGHEGPVISLAFSLDGSTLASGSADTTVRLWDMTKDKTAKTLDAYTTLTEHKDWVNSVAFNSTLLASGSHDKTIRMWNANTGDLQHTLTAHTGSVESLAFNTGVAFNADGNTLASGSADGTVLLWDLAPADDHSNTWVDATPLPLNESLPGVIETDSDVDYFRVEVRSRGELTLYTTGNLDTFGQLERPTGDKTSNNNSGSGLNFHIHHDVIPQTYYVKVTASGSNSTGNYTIHASFTPIRNYRSRVRLIHFIPSGKEYDLNKKHEELKKEMEKVKDFYQREMKRHGHFTNNVTQQFGKTFIFDETPYVVHSHIPEQNWLNMPDDQVFDRVWEDIEMFWGGENWGVFDPTTDIYLAKMEGNYVDGVDGEADIGIGKAIVYNENDEWRTITIAQELGHTFGLGHNFEKAQYMMSSQYMMSYCNPTRGSWWGCDVDDRVMVMSEITADWLDVHRAFNPPQAANDNPAAIEIVEPVNGIVLRGAPTFNLVVRYEDNDVLHQIHLYVPMTEAEPFADPHSMKLYNAYTLQSGNTAGNLTYSNFSDVMADRDIIKINIRTIDNYGNMESTERTLIRARRADIDNNNVVGAEDVAIVTEILHGREPPEDYADVNGDGSVDVHDLTLVKNAREDIGNHPPIVRVIYYYPKDEPVRKKYPAVIDWFTNRTRDDLPGMLESVQDLFATEMEEKGYGRKTFSLETDTEGELMVHEIQSNYTDAELTAIANDPNRFLTDEVWNDIGGTRDINGVWKGGTWAHSPERGTFDPSKDIYLAIVQMSAAFLSDGSTCGTERKDWIEPSGRRISEGLALVPLGVGLNTIGGVGTHCFTKGVVAHELGHAFGLGHIFPDGWWNTGAYVMSYGDLNPFTITDQGSLAPSTAHWLDVHPAFNVHSAFNKARGNTKDSPTIIKIVEPSNVVKSSGSVYIYPQSEAKFSLKVRVMDDDGLHQIQLYVPVTDDDSGEGYKLGDWESFKDSEMITQENWTFDLSALMEGKDIIKLYFQSIDANGNMASAPLPKVPDRRISWELYTLIKAERADVDGNKIVNAEDAAIVDEILRDREPFEAGSLNARADVNGDDKVTGEDADLVQKVIEMEKEIAGAPTIIQISLLPKETSLLANYPNPFNPETWIPYQLAKSADVKLTIYDIQGRVVRDLDLGHQRAGIYHSRARAAHWDGRNAQGESVASGVYFYTLKAGDFTATRKLLIRK